MDPSPEAPTPAAQVHAIGGVFFRSSDPEATRAWYAEHLGLGVDVHGSTFTWRRDTAPESRGHTQWSPFGDDTDYFGDTDQQFMVNYRVDDLDGLLERLRAAGVEIVGEMQHYPFGRFQHIIDGDGRRVELWEPNDVAYEDEVDGATRS